MPVRTTMLHLTLVLLITAGIFATNGGVFVYTLDDPYIHLAVAENLYVYSNYGINPAEFSTPSSSMLWPLLLSPFAPLLSLDLLQYVPLTLNVLFSILVLVQIKKIVAAMDLEHKSVIILNIVLVLFVVMVCNFYGLIFNGMEHMLQLLIAVSIVRMLQSESPASWHYILLGSAHLVRFELIAVTLPVLIYFYLRGEKRPAAAGIAGIAVSMALLVLFFELTTGLPLPSSITMKMTTMQSLSPFEALARRPLFNAFNSPMLPMLLLAGAFLYGFRRRLGIEGGSGLIIVATVPVALHLFFGSTGWQDRYENYVLLFSLLTLLLALQTRADALIQKHTAELFMVLISLLMLFNANKIVKQLFIPLSSNAIYVQQYKMAQRVKAMGVPFAANDVGLVSYRNKNYVLDLYGLANPEIAKMRLHGERVDTQAQMARHGVRHAVVFPEVIAPADSWTELERFCTGSKYFTVSLPCAVMYEWDGD